MKLYRVQFTRTHSRHCAYVMAGGVVEACEKVKEAYTDAKIAECVVWGYDMVVF